MNISFFSRGGRRRRMSSGEIDPDEILIDARNLPEFEDGRFEGHIEKSISRAAIITTGVIFLLIGFVFFIRLYLLEVQEGTSYAIRSTENRLRHSVVFANRGVIYDRVNTPLSWNETKPGMEEFAARTYADIPGLAHVVGYVKYPKKDSSGYYYTDRFEGKAGAERFFDSYLSGENGTKIIETDAHGTISSENLLAPKQDGKNLILSVDSTLTARLHRAIEALAGKVGFRGGAGVIMDVRTGEIVALTSYPEYSSKLMTDASDSAAISRLQSDAASPFLNRAVSGVYTPGSIVKPFMALAALHEGVITPEKQILSTGSISIPNPYDPEKPTIFNDWRPQGWVDVRHALAVSSNVYFFEVGGGFESQKGIGIQKINSYLRLFGFGEEVPGDFFAGETGVVPDPQWKADHFDGEEWRIGDTYNTSIGQYGFQVTAMQAVRGVAAIANGGTLLVPTIVYQGNEFRDGTTTPLPFTANEIKIVQEGMRLGVTEGIAKALNIPGLSVAAKTGTAELGSRKEYVNSWVTGFFPFEKPRYAFAVIMERGPRTNIYGAVLVAKELFEWMRADAPEYFKTEAPKNKSNGSAWPQD